MSQLETGDALVLFKQLADLGEVLVVQLAPVQVQLAHLGVALQAGQDRAQRLLGDQAGQAQSDRLI